MAHPSKQPYPSIKRSAYGTPLASNIKALAELNRQRNDFGQLLAEVPKEKLPTLTGKPILVSSLSVAGK